MRFYTIICRSAAKYDVDGLTVLFAELQQLGLPADVSTALCKVYEKGTCFVLLCALVLVRWAEFRVQNHADLQLHNKIKLLFKSTSWTTLSNSPKLKIWTGE